MNKKIIAACAAAGGVVVLVLVLFFTVFFNTTDSYREIKIYKIEGSTNVERSGDQAIDAYENMQLMNEDLVNVLAESFTQLKMDEDKYALLEPLTSIRLEATGDAKDSNTKITLEKGSVVNHLDNPLSEKSSYEVNTPNSTMAVRGTTFKVESYVDADGVSHTVLEVIDGNVETYLVNPDGSKTEGKVFTAGQKIIIKSDDKETVFEFESKVNLKELNLKELEFLKVHFNEEYYCTEQEINDAIDFLRNADAEKQDNTDGDSNTENGNTDNTVVNQDESNIDTDNNTDNEEETTYVDDNDEPDSDDNDADVDTESNDNKDNSSDKSDDNDKKDDKTDKDKKDKTDDKDKKDNTDDKDTTDKKDTTDNKDTSENKDTKTDTTDNKDNDKKETEYTVTFKYNNEVFASQTVKAGEKAKEPTLRPTANGKWNYSFDKAVEDNITVEWEKE